MKKIFYTFSLILISGLPLFSQSVWNTLTMPSPGFCYYNDTYDIEWDHNGKMYVGTNYGLCVYDGSSWLLYDYPSTFLQFCSVMGIAFDSSHTLWIGSNYGLCSMDTLGNWDSLSTYNSSLPLPFITHVFIDANDTKWLLGREWQGGYPGLIKYDGSAFTIYDTSNTPAFRNNIYDMKMDHQGNIWLGGDSLILKFDGTTWRSYTEADWGIPNSKFGTFEIDSQNNLWFMVSEIFGTHYLIRFDGNTFLQMPPLFSPGTDHFSSMTIDDDGYKWVIEDMSTFNYYKFDGFSWHIIPISTPQIIGRIKARGNYIWSGTSNADPNSDIYCYSDNGFNKINGVGYDDLNGDAVRQANEPTLPTILFHLMPQNEYTFSDTSGYHFILSDSVGNYTVSPVLPPYWLTTTSSLNISHTFFGEITDNVDFDLRHEGNANDVSITITPGVMRPGFQAGVTLNYKNKSSNILSDTITLIAAPGLTFNGSYPPPFFQSNDSVQWLYSSLVPFESRTIQINYSVSSNLQIGDPINLFADIQPISTDTFPSDNIDSSLTFVTGSYDPNDKQVRPQGNILPTQMLEYTIRFQNTGSDTAFTVIVRDTLSQQLDLSTLEIAGSSHPCSIHLQGHVLEFKFENILLPDSNVNELQSHGFIKYRIRPVPGISNGAVISNSAGIIFDFNYPVFTNTTVNTVDYFLSSQEMKISSQLQIIPVPVRNIFKVSFPNPAHKPFILTIYDATGRIILKESSGDCNNGLCTIELDRLNNNIGTGIYFVTLQNEEKVLSRKFVCVD